jgi:hypothetical protein
MSNDVHLSHHTQSSSLTLLLPDEGPLLLVGGDCCPRVSPPLGALLLPVDVESDRHLTTNAPSRLWEGQGCMQADAKWQQVRVGFEPLTSEKTRHPPPTMPLCLVHQWGHGYRGCSVVAAGPAHRLPAATAGPRRPASLLQAVAGEEVRGISSTHCRGLPIQHSRRCRSTHTHGPLSDTSQRWRPARTRRYLGTVSRSGAVGRLGPGHGPSGGSRGASLARPLAMPTIRPSPQDRHRTALEPSDRIFLTCIA